MMVPVKDNNGEVKTQSSYLEHLPSLYRDDEMMGQLLLIFESVMKPIENTVDNIPLYFDPQMIPEPLLPWLASWLDVALDQEWPVGMSFLLTKGDQLYGRYWGSLKRINHLHFNACYYGPIEWAINHGIKRFDPGAGSTHKLRRGFVAVPNHSLHRFYDPRLQQIMRQHIDEINQMEQQHIEDLNKQLPFSEHK